MWCNTLQTILSGNQHLISALLYNHAPLPPPPPTKYPGRIWRQDALLQQSTILLEKCISAMMQPCFTLVLTETVVDCFGSIMPFMSQWNCARRIISVCNQIWAGVPQPLANGSQSLEWRQKVCFLLLQIVGHVHYASMQFFIQKYNLSNDRHVISYSVQLIILNNDMLLK